jgi:hypothetical protein
MEVASTAVDLTSAAVNVASPPVLSAQCVSSVIPVLAQTQSSVSHSISPVSA